MLTLRVALVIVVGHFVADWLCQSDWMALHKSKRWDALTWHVLVYTTVLSLIVALSQPPAAYPYGALVAFLWFVFVNGLAHFIQDAITSRITSRLWFFRQEVGVWVWADGQVPHRFGGRQELVNPWMPTVGDRHWFFVAIGADQLLHYVTLFVTASWWLR